MPRDRSQSYATFDAFRKRIQLRVCNVILQWVKKYGHDFLGKDGNGLSAELSRFCEETLSEDNPTMAKQIKKGYARLVRLRLPLVLSAGVLTL